MDFAPTEKHRQCHALIHSLIVQLRLLDDTLALSVNGPSIKYYFVQPCRCPGYGLLATDAFTFATQHMVELSLFHEKQIRPARFLALQHVHSVCCQAEVAVKTAIACRNRMRFAVVSIGDVLK